MPLPFTHLLSVDQLNPELNRTIFEQADAMAELVANNGRSDLLADKVIALLFFEPSSRTMLSFQTAVQRLGAGMITVSGKEQTSFKKGETLEDTITMVAGYADAIVMRHDEAGSAKRAATVCPLPFINAGDGGNQHPTQALLDLYTIWKQKGTLENLHFAFACDPKHSRTIRSLAFALSQYPSNRLTFISPPNLTMGDDLRAELTKQRIEFTESTKLTDGLDADILYMNRLQEERFVDRATFERERAHYVLSADMLVDSNTLIMNPLPRVDEMEPDVDTTKNAIYFKQARNGVPVRMALLAMMLGKR